MYAVLKQIQHMLLCVCNHESCIHHYQSETKIVKVVEHLTFDPKKNAKPVPSAFNVMASVFWHPKGILLVVNVANTMLICSLKVCCSSRTMHMSVVAMDAM